MSKTKIKNRRQFTAEQRDQHLMNFIDTGLNSMHICFHTGSPGDGLIIGRSLLPLLIKRIHRTMVNRPHAGQSLDQILEDLFSQHIVDECTHVSLRHAAAALGDYGSGRDLKDVMAACEQLRRITRSAAFKQADEARRTAKAKKATDRRRPALLRWASAAAGLFGVAGS